MTDREFAPLASRERLEILDVLRGLAVCGILIGNMQWFSGYGMMPPVLVEQAPLADKITSFLVHFLVEGKFYSIFSFLFGFGFALQIARASERGDTKASIFKRRLFWLLVIGILHAYLLWAGDILSIYALMGFVLLLFRNTSNKWLLRWTAILVCIPVVTYLILYLAFTALVPANVLAQFEAGQIDRWNESVATVTGSSYLQIVTDFNLQYVAGRYAGLIIQMRLPKILAMFLLGLYAYRIGVFQDLSANRPLVSKVLLYGLTFGLAGNLAMALLAGNEGPFPPSIGAVVGVAGYAVGVPALALGIAALVATLWQTRSMRRVLLILAPVGRMALTNYLMQTIICVTMFYGYGFGYFGRFGAFASTMIAFAIFAFQIVASTLWLKYFTYGPMEWIWRQLTYKQQLPLRR